MRYVTRVSVVIPYYQRDPGILRRAVTSIYAQELPEGIAVDVIVVDDASSAPPESEVAGLAREGMSVKIVKRSNGGVAKARNTGLEAAAGSDIVAFLDSDDSWSPRHLSVGLGAIARGAEFYFSDVVDDGINTWLNRLRCRDAFLTEATADGDGIQWISGAGVMKFMLDECLAHTSSVIFDYRRHGTIRFDEDLVLAGEDHFFWVSLASAAASIAFTTSPTVSRGRGIDLYRSTFDWSHPECIRRLFDVLIMHKKMLERFCRTPASKEILNIKLGRLRRGILFLLVRNAVRHGHTNGWVILELARKDARFWLDLPRNTYVTVATKLRGSFELPAEM